MAYNLKTATPGSASASALIFGAETQSSADPSVYNTTGSGSVVLSTSPSLTTPTLGVASATSVNKLTITTPATGSTLTVLDGKTLTANNSLTLAGTDGTTMTFPSTSGTVATLNTANLFTKANTFQPDSDAQAGTFRRNSSGQTANVVEIQTEANAFLAAFDKTGALTIGAASGNTGALKLNGTTSGVVTLSTADAAGTWTMKLPTSAGTNNYVLATDGSGNTSWVAQSGGTLTVNSTATSGGAAGQIMFDTGSVLSESAGLTFDATNKALTVGGATVTTSNPVLNLSQTWNAAGVTFTGLKLNVTNTASASGSLLLDMQVGGASVFSLRKDGRAIWPAAYIDTVGGSMDISVSPSAIRIGGSAGIFPLTNNAADLGYASGGFSWKSITTNGYLAFEASSTVDCWLRRAGAATFQLGNSDAASPVAQTLQVQGSRSGTDSNVGGGNLTIQSGKGTGTGTLSAVYLKSPQYAGAGAGAQSLATGLTILNGSAVLSSYAFASIPAANTSGSGALIVVTDSGQTSGQITSGGSTNKVLAISNGTNWYVVFLVP